MITNATVARIAMTTSGLSAMDLARSIAQDPPNAAMGDRHLTAVLKKAVKTNNSLGTLQTRTKTAMIDVLGVISVKITTNVLLKDHESGPAPPVDHPPK